MWDDKRRKKVRRSADTFYGENELHRPTEGLGRKSAGRQAYTDQFPESQIPVRHRNDPYYDELPTWRTTEKNRKKRGCLMPFTLLVVVLLALLAVAFFMVRRSLGTIERTELDQSMLCTVNEDPNMKGYQNIALFGVDDQDNTIRDKGSRTDSIIIASINKRNHKVKLLSVYRDTYVSIYGEYNKINAAYSFGGPQLAVQTLNRNLDLNITDFATVNFKALADAVDTVGGIELTIKTEKELENLNDYIGNMNKINGGDSPRFDSVGTYTFDGNQAVAYSRIRYMEGGDHERSNHQRLVVDGIVKKVKRNPLVIPRLTSTVLPQCKTSLSSTDMTSLLATLLLTDITDSQGYPFDSSDARYNGIYYGFPKTARSNAAKAHLYLFGTEDYQVSDELGKISDKIQYITDSYGF